LQKDESKRRRRNKAKNGRRWGIKLSRQGITRKALSCGALSYNVLPCLMLFMFSCPVLCLVLSCLVLSLVSCLAMSRLVLFCEVSSWFILSYFYLQPGEGGYLLSSCLVFTKAGQHEQAMAYFDRAIEVCPDGPKSHDFHCKKTEVLQAMCCCLSRVSLHLGLLLVPVRMYVFVCVFEPFVHLYLLQIL
jgi:hypothetical protein